MIKAVIFDMDGVLADSHNIFNQLFTTFVKNDLGLDISIKEFARFPGMRFDKRVEIIAEEKGIKVSNKDVEAAIHRGRVEYYNNSLSYVKLFPGVIKLFEELKLNGIKIALGTNGDRNTVEKLLNLLKIKKYFSSIVTFDDVYAGKPSPHIFLKNAENLKLNPNECVVVEDAVEGIEAAKSARMKVIAVLTTQTKEELKEADMIVKSIKEINLGIIQTLAK